MTTLSTHVLDTERGEPAMGVPVALLRWDGGDLVLLAAYETNQDGRIPSFMDEPLPVGSYQLAFDVAAYFRRQGREIAFLTKVVVEFQILEQRHYHVPLLLSRYSCTSYRGS
ncbi:MAG: hydroxyisourate hydrolase [Roseiflexaceae bacterium]